MRVRRSLGGLAFAQLLGMTALLQPALADPIASGENADGVISASGETDSWTFSAAIGDRIVLRVAETGGITAFSPRLELRSPTNVFVDSNAGNPIAEVAVTATAAGTYTVLLSDGSASGKLTGSYRLRLAKLPGGFIVGDDGGEIVNGQNHDAEMDLGDLDLWSFAATAGDRIVLRIAETGDNTVFAPRIRLYAPDGSLIDSSTGSRVSEVAVTAATSGTYIALTSDDSAALSGTGAYRLRLAKLPGSFVVGDDGGEIVNGQNHDGQMDVGDLDLWSFAATAGDRIVLRIAEIGADSALTPQMRLYAPDGSLLDVRAGGRVAEIVSTVVTSGTYTVLASDDSTTLSATGAYQLRLARMPGDFVVGDDGGHVASGEEHEGTVTIGDLDLWTFAATAGNSVVVHVAELSGVNGFDPQIRLYAPDGMLVDSDADALVAEISVTAGDTGLYVALVDDGNASGSLAGTGTYLLTVTGNVECTSATVCRASAGACDVEERCDDYACPPDARAPAATVCRNSGGPCDVAETCNGSSTSCPINGLGPSSTLCRAAQGVCDAPEMCSGQSAVCPADQRISAGTACGDDGNSCTDDLCNGSSPLCQHAHNSLPCSDGVFCNGTDTCSGGVCSHHSGDPCTGVDGDSDCAETCVEAADSCTGPDSDGSPCDDGDVCTQMDVCESGVCTGVSELECPTTTTTLPEILCGDANGDGEVTASDALHALRAAVGTDSCPLSACDYSGDGEITAGDALAILRASVGLAVSPSCPAPSAHDVATTSTSSTTTTTP